LKRTTRRPDFFRALARYLQAGLTPDRGLCLLAEQLSRHTRPPFLETARQVQRGQSFAAAGLRAGILLPGEARLLAPADAHGRLDLALDNLADHLEQATQWRYRLRMRLVFPAAILVLGFLALPLPALIAGQLSMQAYLLQNLLLAAALVTAWNLPVANWIRHRFPDVILHFKTLGKPVRQYQRQRFLVQLACLYNAGVTMLDALPVAVNSCDSTLLRSRWSLIAAAIRQGRGISESLHRYEALDDTGYALVHAGETAGRLGDMLDREARRLGEGVALWREGLLDWLPRVAYLVVLLFLFSRW
jgi:general secretion pathway protein F